MWVVAMVTLCGMRGMCAIRIPATPAVGAQGERWPPPRACGLSAGPPLDTHPPLRGPRSCRLVPEWDRVSEESKTTSAPRSFTFLTGHGVRGPPHC